jgi:nicotinamide-nucleotide amidase
LAALGADVQDLRIVGDAEPDVARAIADAAAEAEVVLVSGGLGPTPDDRTREGLAAAAGADLVEDEDAVRLLEAALRAQGRVLDAPRRGQARMPRGARTLPNPAGTAPGIRVDVRGATVYALPGVPRELRAMFEAAVRPELEGRGGLLETATGGVWTSGLGEPDVATRLDALAARHDVEVGFYPHEGEVEVRLRARGGGAARRVDGALREARRLLGAAVSEPGPIQHAVVEALRRSGLRLTTAESMTGGLIARMLVEVPGASDVFPGGWVTYSDAWKRDALGVSAALLAQHGAVSPEVAAAMAEGARGRAATDAALSVTGIAGPDDGRDPRGRPIPRGTFHVGLALAGRPTETRSLCLPFDRLAVQRRAAVLALDLLRRALFPRPVDPGPPG